MLFYNYNILLFTFIKLCYSNDVSHVSEFLKEKLDSIEKKSICCKNNLKCCKAFEKYPFFEVKTILTDCPKKKCNYCTNQIPIAQNKSKPPQEKLTNCNQKLLLTVKIVNQGILNKKSQYVVIDYVMDSTTMKKIKILNPYVVRIRQEAMMQVYGLEFEKEVNAEAREVVHNMHSRNYRDCDVELDNPTCGVAKQNGKIVPFSQGFCCSCEENVKSPFSEMDSFSYLSAKRPKKSTNSNETFFIKNELRREQNCAQNINDRFPSKQRSTHCLKFSNLWYSVYRLEKPNIVHKLKVQLFQKYEDCHGNTHWTDLTQGKIIKLGTPLSCNLPELNAIISRYTSENAQDCNFALNYRKHKLLVPETKVSNPEKFMVVPKNIVSLDGKNCNSAGVGYEAFYKQKKRCSRPKGSCLKNQPQHLYDKDSFAEKQGKSGNHFLKYFGSLAEDPVTYNSTGQMQYLRLAYTKRHVSNIYFELNADLVTLVESNAFATITEVYTDGTDIKKTKIVIKVTNSGLVYGIFYVRLTGCPLNVPASLNNIASKSVFIPPQHQHIFNLFIEYPLSSSELNCRIQVHNIYQELISFRAIKIQAYDRCICVWYCECTCYNLDRRLKCVSMLLESYHSAGFQGGLPFATNIVENSYLDEMLKVFFHTFIFLVLTLLGMGLIKALVGLCSKEIGLWGLNTILGTDQISSYACDNKNCEFRQENNISLSGQFCLNLIFFFVYPLALINIAIKNMCFSSYTLEDDSCSCEERWIDYEECQDPENCNLRKRRSSMESNAKTISMEYTSSEPKSSP